MGALISCCFGGGSGEVGPTVRDSYQTFQPSGAKTQSANANDNTPNPEEKRRQMAEAAERRRQAQEGRGVKDVEAVRRAQKKQDELERLEREAALQGTEGGGLRWQVS